MHDVQIEEEVQDKQFFGQSKQIPFYRYLPVLHEEQY